ncbi:MAG: RDD family protein [Armatimonadota bacterium]
MSRTVEFYTPEQVAIQYELAGVGSRGTAALVDGLLQLLLYLALLLIPYVLYMLDILPPWISLGPETLITLLVMGHFFIVAGYHVFFETLWNGETPGKRWMGLRVIKDGGYPVDFRSVVIRNLVRIADILPGLYGLGLIVSLMHKKYQRLGDLAGGTLVVTHGHEQKLHEMTMGNAQVFRLLDASVLSQLSRLSREEYRLVQRFLERRSELPAGLQAEFTQRLALQLIVKFGYQQPELGMDYLRWLEELDLAYRRRALGIISAEPAPGAGTPAPAAAAPAQPAPSVASDGRKW